ncbi:MAG: EAL domain-containing protein [Planctomycetota bacterium]
MSDRTPSDSRQESRFPLTSPEGLPVDAWRSSTPRRVLVIDDNPAIHSDFKKILVDSPLSAAASDRVADAAKKLFADALQPANKDRRRRSGPRFELAHASGGAEGVEIIRQATEQDQPYELVFVDMRMPPGIDGIETVRQIWEIDHRIQTCICTAYSDRAWGDVLDELGTSDRLLILKKPFDLIEIRQIAVALSEKWRLARRAEQHVDQLELLVRSRTADLQRAQVLDRLTNLPNRRTFQQRLSVAVQQSEQDPDYRFGLVFIDVDRFKLVNESVGEAAGDELLRIVGNRLGEAVRLTDVVGQNKSSGTLVDDDERRPSHTAARIGGDEFVVLLNDLTDDDDAEVVAQRLCDVLSEPYSVGDKPVAMTASLGVTSSVHGYGTAEDALRDADAAMRQVKMSGRGNVAVFSKQMREESRRRARVETDLRGAADRGELRVVYQPIVRAGDGTLAGFEALIRWQHPNDGLLSPAAFIDTAEESGLIGEIGGWMLDEAAGAFAGWLSRDGTGLAPIPATLPSKNDPSTLPVAININLSRRQLLEPDLVERVAEVQKRYNLGGGRLKLEVTESGVMENPDESVQRLRELRNTGVRVVMDDFGTGYSSLSCLHQFPLDCVKLDRSFIRQLGQRDDYAAVIEAIVTLTKAMKIDLVAEGVENLLQWDMLKDLGCDLLQGYLFGKPLDPDIARGLVMLPTGSQIIDGRLATADDFQKPAVSLAA